LGRKLILLELNEVPLRVIESFCRRNPESNLARCLPRCRQYETFTEDKLALDPWISWPTFHRGVNDEIHQVLHLGQVADETDSRFPPIWRLIRSKGLSVGVFGSLHSSSIPADAASYSFYVPDYFDADVFAHPPELRVFQQLNLLMTRQSARNVTRELPIATLARFLASAPGLGLRFATIADSVGQLARELRDPTQRVRRRAYQPLIMADLFMRQLERTLPDFATFYTNHVAAAMHRYWGATFPEDYQKPLEAEWIERYGQEIHFAMEKFDRILGQMIRFLESHPEYTLMIGSSMGQAAIPAEKNFDFLTITDIGKFMSELGVPAGAWQARPAMVPCQNVVVDARYRETVVAGIQRVSIAGSPFVQDRRPIAPMSYDERERGFFQFFVQFDSYKGPPFASIDGRKVSLGEAGMGVMVHEDGVNCTAQHVSEGSLLVYRHGSHAPLPREITKVSTLDMVPSILRFFGFDRPDYMRGSPSVALAD